jgi:hypothetical protein
MEYLVRLRDAFVSERTDPAPAWLLKEAGARAGASHDCVRQQMQPS